MDFGDLYMSFTKEGHKHTLKDLQSYSPKIMIPHYIEISQRKFTTKLLPNSMLFKLWITLPSIFFVTSSYF